MTVASEVEYRLVLQLQCIMQINKQKIPSVVCLHLEHESTMHTL